MNNEIQFKEIHFYTSLCDERCAPEKDLDTILIDLCATLQAIKDEEKIIRTTQTEFLADSWDLIDRGYSVYIHMTGGRIMQVHEHMKGVNGKDIRRGHNIAKILLGGVFGEY